MVNNHYRWDFIGLSTDDKPTSETSEKVVNGSTFYCSDTSKLYVYCDGTWYERKPLGGGGGGGTSDFDELDNRPKYDNTMMTGNTNIPKVPTTTELTNNSGFITSSDLPTVNDATLTITQNGVSAGTFTSNDADDTTIALTDTTYSTFTGTDGTSAGAAGLVPAPATTDAGKFLKADGTWATAGGGGGTGAVIELTTDDYDYTQGNYTGIALWRLQAGLYHTANEVQAFAGNDSDFKLSLKSHLIIIDDSGNQKLIKVIGDEFSNSFSGVYKGFVEYKVAASDGSGVFTQSESVVSTASLMIKRSTTPTSSDIGFRGQLWYDTTNNKLYINVNRPTDYAGNWKEITIV